MPSREVTCQMTPGRAMDRPPGAFAPSILEMSVRHGPPRGNDMRSDPQPDRKPLPRQPSSKSSGQLELLRTRVAAAESLLKVAREQADRAKRRRKLAKLLAKRARKGAKQAKADLARVRKTLAEAEAKLANSVVRLAIRKPVRARTRSVAEGVIAAPPRAEATLITGDNRRTAKRKRTTSKRKPVARSPSALPPNRSSAPRKLRDLSRGTLPAPTDPRTTPSRFEEMPVTLDAETAQPA